MAEKENLSRFFDGENLDQAWIDKLELDTSWEEDWRSFALTRDILRGEASEASSWDISGKVAAALENEPTYGQEKVIHQEPLKEQALQDQPLPQSVRRTLPAWLQQLTQVGMAAGVALAVIVGVQEFNTDIGAVSLGVTQPPVLQTLPLSGLAKPVSFSREAQLTPSTEAQLLEQRLRINALFQDYELQNRLNATEIASSPWVSQVSEGGK